MASCSYTFVFDAIALTNKLLLRVSGLEGVGWDKGGGEGV